jgi:hypothetical protein
MRLRVVDGCPCPASIAPYVHIVLRAAGHVAASIYRGEDAKALLHAHGKHTQAEIHRMYPGISNPAGRSEHELRSDGAANPGPVGRRLEEWEIGVDSGTNSHADKMRVNAAAAKYGWKTRHPYSRGVEGHHWCFARRPRPKGLKMRAKIIRLRATLPRR